MNEIPIFLSSCYYTCSADPCHKDIINTPTNPGFIVVPESKMVMFKLSPLKASIAPLKSFGKNSKKSVGKQFRHVSCTDEEVSMYFRDLSSARNAMMELENRSWEYQFEFAAEMSKRCRQ